MTTGKAVIGVLAGLAAGAALGVLFAPKKGSDTRKTISKKGEDLAQALNDKVDQKFDELVNAITGSMKKPKMQSEMKSKEAEMVG
jgi:gas vesicle protein